MLKDRLGQLNSRLVFVQTEYSYNGKLHNIARRTFDVFSVVSKHDSAELVCYEDNCGNDTLKVEAGFALVSWGDFMSRGTGRQLIFMQVPFDQPLVIMFSSGTTGSPKGIVHSHGVRIHLRIAFPIDKKLTSTGSCDERDEGKSPS